MNTASVQQLEGSGEEEKTFEQIHLNTRQKAVGVGWHHFQESGHMTVVKLSREPLRAEDHVYRQEAEDDLEAIALLQLPLN